METQKEQMSAVAESESPRKEKPRRIPMAVLSFVLTLVGWMLLPFVYQVSMGCAIGGFIAGVIGWRGRRGAWRNLSITCTVASAVLILVFATFWGAIMYFAQ